MKHKSIILGIAVAFLLTGCFGAMHLGTSHLSDPGTIKGSFDVIYYGARYLDDPGSLVVLDVAGDNYNIIPKALKDSYRISQGLPADEAVRNGIKFLKQNKYYDGVIYHAIHALDGTVIGYEMMPQYEQFTYPSRRTITVNYYVGKGDNIRFYVHEHSLNEYGIRTRK